jgi:quercetin dioxygenase-like cupin family protein
MAQPHAQSGQVVNLSPFAQSLPDERTTAIIKAEQLEVVRIVLAAGKTMPEHYVQGEITLLCLEGRITLHTPHGTRELGPADFIHLRRGAPHALTAVVDSSAVLTICLAD